MKKVFLFATIVACAATSFAQTNTTQSQPVKKSMTAPTYKEAQTAKMKQAPMTNNTSTMSAKPQPQATKASDAKTK